jgi:hypothetical protein
MAGALAGAQYEESNRERTTAVQGGRPGRWKEFIPVVLCLCYLHDSRLASGHTSLKLLHWKTFGDAERFDFAANDGDIFDLVNILRRCVPFR